MSILIVAENDHSTEIANVFTAAKQLGDKIDLVYTGDSQVAENIASSLHEIIKNNKYQYVVAAANTFGKNFMPRLAAILDVEQIADITKIINKNTFVRPIYAGNALATYKSSDLIKIITIRPTAFAAGDINIKALDLQMQDLKLAKVIKLEQVQSSRPELTAAKTVVAGGRGLQSVEKFQLIAKLADTLGAAIGASRAAVDAGFIANDHQVGQTGKIVAPELYIAVGISGAIQHLAGMKDSKIIVAINKDAAAPIFQIADYGLVGDLFKILPELVEEIEKVLQ